MQSKPNLSLLKVIRDKWHPLFHLRKSRLFQYFINLFDFPVWVKLFRISHPVCVYSVRHATVFLSPRTIEPEMVALFVAIQEVYAPRTFWDIGAHIGYYSWLLKGLNQTLEVMLFEPDPVNLAMIEKTLLRSGLKNIQVISAAVSDSEGEKTFSLDRFTGQTGTLENPDQAYIKRYYHTAPAVVPVKTLTIDSIRKHSNPVDFIKIDVEGHEAKVLAGAKQTLTRDFPILIFEHFNHDQTMLAYLLEMGYRLYDAERMEAPQAQTTNYLALPPRCFEKSDLLFQKWRQMNESL